MTTRQTTEQRRAAQAWKDIGQVKEDDKSEYKTRAKNLPAMIQINGLGTAMAFLLSKPKKKAYKQIYQHVSSWLVAKDQLNYKGGNGDLMDFIRDSRTDISMYRRATTEAIEYAIWLKRYVESWETVEESND